MRMINRLEEHFNLEVPLGAIFESPSVAELAAYLDASMRMAGRNLLTPDPANNTRESGEI